MVRVEVTRPKLNGMELTKKSNQGYKNTRPCPTSANRHEYRKRQKRKRSFGAGYKRKLLYTWPPTWPQLNVDVMPRVASGQVANGFPVADVDHGGQLRFRVLQRKRLSVGNQKESYLRGKAVTTSAPSKVRNCAGPSPDHLRSAISFSRTSNIPNLSSCIHRVRPFPAWNVH